MKKISLTEWYRVIHNPNESGIKEFENFKFGDTIFRFVNFNPLILETIKCILKDQNGTIEKFENSTNWISIDQDIIDGEEIL